MTNYVVLKKNEDGWKNPGIDISARGARAAIKEAAEAFGEGEYVAIPARSWKPVTVKVETKTALKFS